MPDADAELSDEGLKWRKELDAAIFDLVTRFAPEDMVVDKSCQADWIRKLRNHVERVYEVFGDSCDNDEVRPLRDRRRQDTVN